MALTPSQKAAVNYDQNLIIFAGPGSGKTSTSVEKAARILASGASTMGMVTFTSHAAAEMRLRMEALFKGRNVPFPHDHFISGTFNALALRHYQKYARVKEKLLAPPARSAMINTMLAGLSPDEKGATILALDRYQGSLNPHTVELSEFEQKFVDDYLHKLQSARAIDLATVMRKCTQMMASKEIPLLPVTHLLGDEMQDADQVQLEFMLVHSRAGVITTLVADDDQTIYEWRSALGYAGLQHFAREANAKTVTLNENFRSREEIVAHAKRLIAFNDPERIEKNQQAVRGPGGVLGFVSSSSITQECDLVAKCIELHREPDETVAILARVNKSLDFMESALSKLGITYQREGPSIWETSEVTTFVSLLRALSTKSTADLLPVLGLLGLDDRVRRDLEKRLGASCESFMDGVIPELGHATETDMETLREFVKDTTIWRNFAREGEVRLLLPNVKDGLKDMFRHHHNDSEDSKRMYRVKVLLDTAGDILFDMKGSLKQRLNVISRVRTPDPDSRPVRLMTMHSSKGLEFDTVFLIDAKKPEDGSTLMDDHPERRLFFVGLTRAKERFAVTYSNSPVKFVQESDLHRMQSLSHLYGFVSETEPANTAETT